MTLSPTECTVGDMNTQIRFFEITGPVNARLLAFYNDVLGVGFTPHPDDPSYAMNAPTDGAIVGALWDSTEAFGVAAYAMPYIEVADVDAAANAVTAAGGVVVVPPRHHGPTRVAHILDPAGNRIGIFTGPLG